ncbi:MAG: hypothetical protein ACI8WB_004423, partial [Phenylobacterium sp.]
AITGAHRVIAVKRANPANALIISWGKDANKAIQKRAENHIK